MTSIGAYTSADLVTGGWVFGFLLVGAAGLSVRRTRVRVHEPLGADQHVVAKPSALRLSLPYLPLVAAGVALCVQLLQAPSTPIVDLVLGVGLVVLVLSRQFLAMADNQRLLGALAVAAAEIGRASCRERV